MGYESVTSGECDTRFLGVEVNRIGDVPEGMIAWDLNSDTWRVFGGQGAKIWQGQFDWQWFASKRTVGEFTTQCRLHWMTCDAHSISEFHITSNAYFEPGKDADDDVLLVDYDESWPQQFEETAQWLRDSLGSDMALRVEHYGSTAIPGMSAKPVIDVLVEVPSFAKAKRRAIPVFNCPECEYWSYSNHMIFIVRDGYMGKRTHHIHMAPRGHDLWKGLLFRDYLRTHQEEASRYVALKNKLAERYSTDRERYTDAKTTFVEQVTAKALQKHSVTGIN
jgi:GrpB-like predicted nucleotidyltransferase (UPF0157 family)